MQKLPLILVTPIVALGLYLILLVISNVSIRGSRPDPAAALDYQGYSEGINTLRFDETGDIRYTLQAERQVYFKDSSSLLDQPRIRFLRNGVTHWNVVADNGRIMPPGESSTGGAGTVELSGSVLVENLDPLGQPIVLKTQSLSIDTQRKTLQTSRLVTMTTSNIEQTAQGMFADLGSDQVVFTRNTRGSYETSDSF